MLIYQWILLLIFSLAFLWMSPLAKTVAEFYKAQTQDKEVSSIVLMASLVISWIFAKSITNAANLSMEFGILGGISYGLYYLSFMVAGIVIYQLRTEGGFSSLHHFLESKYGRTAVWIFTILIGFRLFNEVWSNTMVIGSYFGESGSMHYYLSILVFTLLTLLYSLKGGMSSSIMTDVIQMIFFAVMLVVILTMVLTDGDFSVTDYTSSSDWKMNAGLNFFFVALIQVFSYPFHDAVLTDRGFIADSKKTLKAFLWAAIVGFICILLFSLVGVYARLSGLEGQAAVEVSKLFGIPLMLIMNFIMITSAASTLDSTFISSAKLIDADLNTQKQSLKRGRWIMIIFTIIGTIPIFLNPTILSATTISGTMVLGLAPIFILWKMKSNALAFYLTVGVGIIVGILFTLQMWPESLTFFEGRYGVLLSANIIGAIFSLIVFLITSMIGNSKTMEIEPKGNY